MHLSLSINTMKKSNSISCQCGGLPISIFLGGYFYCVCRGCFKSTSKLSRLSEAKAKWAKAASDGKLVKVKTFDNKVKALFMWAAKWNKTTNSKVFFNGKRCPELRGSYIQESDCFHIIDGSLFLSLKQLPGGFAPLRECQ